MFLSHGFSFFSLLFACVSLLFRCFYCCLMFACCFFILLLFRLFMFFLFFCLLLFNLLCVCFLDLLCFVFLLFSRFTELPWVRRTQHLPYSSPIWSCLLEPCHSCPMCSRTANKTYIYIIYIYTVVFRNKKRFSLGWPLPAILGELANLRQGTRGVATKSPRK